MSTYIVILRLVLQKFQLVSKSREALETNIVTFLAAVGLVWSNFSVSV